MAVQNYLSNYGTSGYNPTEDTYGVPENWALQQGGVGGRYAQQTISALSTDNNGSTYLLMRHVPADSILAACLLEVDPNTGGTSYSIGLYDSNLGTPVAANCFMNAFDLHAGSTKLVPFDGLLALTHEQMLVALWSLAGDTLLTKKGAYDIVMTANTAASTAFKLTARMNVIDGG
jgi:hypothetical protein